MAQFLPRNAQAPSAGGVQSAAVDVGLRAHMLRVYNYLSAGLALAAIIAYSLFSMAVTTDPALTAATLRNGVRLTAFGKEFFQSPLFLVIMFAPLVMCIGLIFFAQKLSAFATQAVYWTFVVLLGAGLSTVFLKYKLGSVAQVLAITSASFAALSLYGYTTKRDLSGMATFLVMGLFGLIIASLLNIWLQSSGLQFAISCIGVLVFAGFTAYDTQQIKDQYYVVAGDADGMTKAAAWGALSLFLDFINLFQFLLSLLGSRE